MTYEIFANIARNDFCYYVSVLTKKSYTFDMHGEVSTADEQEPLAMDIQLEAHDARTFQAVKHGIDSWPFKLNTDVVVDGTARSLRPTRRMMTEVQVGAHRKRVAVFGNRYVDYRGPGSLRFTEPEPFEAIPLNWFNAYGGIDPTVLPKSHRDTPTAMGEPVFDLFPGVYPRNPAGTGYFINDTKELLEQGPLVPNLEDPDHLLCPETFLVGDAKSWWRCPLPQSYGWVRSLWFPRCIHAGSKPYHLPPEDHLGALEEIKRQELSMEDFTMRDYSSPLVTLRMTNEASSGLALPYLRGDEPVLLKGFDPRGDLGFVLPNERPLIAVKADGKPLFPDASRLHTLHIDADKAAFSVLRSHQFNLVAAHWAELFVENPKVEAFIDRFEIRVDDTTLTADHWPQPDEEE